MRNNGKRQGPGERRQEWVGQEVAEIKGERRCDEKSEDQHPLT
jgi:hypothetical protein